MDPHPGGQLNTYESTESGHCLWLKGLSLVKFNLVFSIYFWCHNLLFFQDCTALRTRARTGRTDWACWWASPSWQDWDSGRSWTWRSGSTPPSSPPPFSSPPLSSPHSQVPYLSLPSSGYRYLLRDGHLWRDSNSVSDRYWFNADPDAAFFFLMADPDPGVWWPKIAPKNVQLKKKRFPLHYFDQKFQLSYPLGLHKSIKDANKLQEKPSALKRGHPAIQNMKFLYLSFYFCGSFLPSWIRIRISSADPDQETQINVDPWASGSETEICMVLVICNM